MPKVGIVTDSTSCLPPELVKEYDIRVVPLRFSIDGREYIDNITQEEFWRLFREAKEMPTTSAISPGVFAQTFAELGKVADSIVCILVSKVLSATNEAAVEAKALVKSDHPQLNIEIVDSKTSTGALGFIALEAARAAWAGKNLAEVVRVAQDMIPRVKFLVGMDTLKYLIKTGRAPKTAYMGELFQVKPIIGMVSGTGLVESLGRARGKQKCMLKLVEMAKQHIDVNRPVHFFVHYTDSVDAGNELRNLVTSRFNCAELYFTPCTPVMSSATGPVVALAFYS